MSAALDDIAQWISPQPFALESGDTLPQLTLAYRTWGTLSAQADNAVIVCHALTGDVHADRWWAPLFGEGRALDPARDFIVCNNVLGGCTGSSGPASAHPDGERWGARFPAVTARDQVRAQIALADALGIRRIRLVLGGSLGGLHALEWALLDPQRVEAIASIAASAAHSAWCLAWSEAQRLALRADPLFRDGNYLPDAPPQAGLAAARAIAMISYRGAETLQQRFGRAVDHGEDDYTVRTWIRHHGDALVARFDANSYLRLLDAMDSHDVGRGRGGADAALARLHQPALIVSIPSDVLYVPADQYRLLERLPNAQLATLDSAHGHDGFLIDAEYLEPLLRQFRDTKRAPDIRTVPSPRAAARYAGACS